MGRGSLALTPERPGAWLRAYRVASRLASPLLLAWIWWRGRREPAYRHHLHHRLGRIEVPPAALGGLWIHAASLGEVLAVQPLIDRLLDTWPAHSLTVTTQTPTGAQAVQERWDGRLRHLYAPLDTPGAIRRFLGAVQPQALILVERELWPNWIWACAVQAIPVVLINARLSDASAQGYQRWQALMRHVWQHLHVAAADTDTARRLQDLGVAGPRLEVCGNLKFDRPAPAPPSRTLPDTTPWQLVVAGSTHEAEERIWLDIWPEVQLAHPDARLVLVPRHPQRFDAVASEVNRRGLALQRRSQTDAITPATRVLLVDVMGELPHWYELARVCFVGGTLAPVGGHNPLEPMASGQAVLFGPHTDNAAQLFDEALRWGAGLRVTDATSLKEAVLRALKQPDAWRQLGEQALALVQGHTGATARTLRVLNRALGPTWPQRLGEVHVVRHDRDTRWVSAHTLTDDCFAQTSHATAMATGSGRGTAWKVSDARQPFVLRHYRRGGLVARVSEDRFWREAVTDSRAMREFQLLRLMHSWGLPVPEPLAARHRHLGLSYTADIAVALIDGTDNLVQRLRAARPTPADWHTLGRSVRRLHDRQVFHSDLNAHNLLLGPDGQAWVVDFDKCGRRQGEEWKPQNLERLLRSLRKEAGRCDPFHWVESDWQLFLDGYRETA